MSRSRKHQPFRAVCGGGSAKQDKRLANRGVRRGQNVAVRLATDFDTFLVPHRFECSWNETYNWGRDGHQYWRGLTARDRYWYEDSQWPPEWYVRMMRK